MRRHFFIYSILFFYKFFGSIFASDLKSDNFIKITIHNVGQGNCVAAELFETRKKTYLLFDGGSTSFAEEFYLQDYWKDQPSLSVKKPSSKEINIESPRPQARPLSVPLSSKKIISPKTTQKRKHFSQNKSKVSKKTLELKRKAIKEIRRSLGALDENSNVSVKTVFISHPDKDHYGWIPEIFQGRDIIENIILGGLPENYNRKIKEWLTSLVNSTNVYFPAILCRQPIESWSELVKENRLYSSQFFSNTHGQIQGNFEHLENFQQAFPYGELIKTYLLTANPTHYKEEGTDEVDRVCLPDDTNSDSLVIRVTMSDFSMDIMGDATEITTNRILKNYKSSDFLSKTTLTLAAHHGSDTHGSNSEKWIQATSPHYVIFSCGIGGNNYHPKLSTYETFKKSKQLALVPEHDIWVWEKIKTEKKKGSESKKRLKKKYGDTKKKLDTVSKTKGINAIIHTTFQGFFSTFNQGTMTITFDGTLQIKSPHKLLNDPSRLIPDMLRQGKKSEIFVSTKELKTIPLGDMTSLDLDDINPEAFLEKELSEDTSSVNFISHLNDENTEDNDLLIPTALNDPITKASKFKEESSSSSLEISLSFTTTAVETSDNKEVENDHKSDIDSDETIDISLSESSSKNL